jgi:hypothetical protein
MHIELQFGFLAQLSHRFKSQWQTRTEVAIQNVDVQEFNARCIEKMHITLQIAQIKTNQRR